MNEALNEMYLHLLSAASELHQLEENEWNSKRIADSDIQECIRILQELVKERRG